MCDHSDQHHGLGAQRPIAAQARRASDSSEAQTAAVSLLRDDVRAFLLARDTPIPELDWKRLTAQSRVGYDGEMILKAQPLSWARVESALPPPGVAGRVSALKLAAPGLRPYLADPRRSLLPERDWPLPLGSTPIRCEPGQWDLLLEGLHARQIVSFIPRDERVTGRDGSVLSVGLFGVPKGEIGAPGFDPLTAPQRLIVNAVPSNLLQRPITGDIRGLPLFSQWLQAEALASESVLWSAEDQSCSFYLYALPRPWWRFFALSRERTRPLPGVPASHVIPVIRVVPMGWISATGVFQHLHLRLVEYAARRAPPPLVCTTLSREDRQVPDSSGRLSAWMQVYLDNWDQARCVPTRQVPDQSGSPGAFQRALRACYAAWGVARAPKKAVVEELSGATLGGIILGSERRAVPAPSKCGRFLGLLEHCLESQPPRRMVAALLGQACYMAQYARPVFIVLHEVWAYATGTAPWSSTIQGELLAFACLLPVLAIRFDQPTSELVTVSDASEEGAGVCASRSLTEYGRCWLGRRLAPTPGLLEGSVALLESFGGICSARQGLALLGIRPALHLCSELLGPAMKVSSHQWPDVMQLGDVKGITREVLLQHLSSCPRVRLFIHTAGSPCQGFCAWNPFRLKGDESQLRQSMDLFHEVERINALLRELLPPHTLHFVEENVASMEVVQRDYISRCLKVLPTKLRLQQLGPQRRERFFWASWPLLERPQVSLEAREGYTLATLQPTEPLPLKLWAKAGWKPAGPPPAGFRPSLVRVPSRRRGSTRPASTAPLPTPWGSGARTCTGGRRSTTSATSRWSAPARGIVAARRSRKMSGSTSSRQTTRTSAWAARTARRIPPSGRTPEAACSGTASAPPSSPC